MAGHEVHLGWTQHERDSELADYLKTVSLSALLLNIILES